MSFADTLKRLRAATNERQRGIAHESAIIQQRDLLDLLNHFDRLDGLHRATVISHDTARAEARKAALEEAASLAYDFPAYSLGFDKVDEAGTILPGSPYDRGRYDAYKAIRAQIAKDTSEPCKKKYDPTTQSFDEPFKHAK